MSPMKNPHNFLSLSIACEYKLQTMNVKFEISKIMDW